MSDPIQIKRLSKGLQNWNRCRKNAGRRAKPDLSNHTFYGAHFPSLQFTLKPETIKRREALKSRTRPRRRSLERPILNLDLFRIDLTGGDFRGADFSRSVFCDVLFSDADLTSAVFDGAILIGARFDGADLSGTSFRDAQLDGAIFDETRILGADFHGARGLLSTIHRGPSTVDRATITKSRGIPAFFLRRCGWDELDIYVSEFYRDDIGHSDIMRIAEGIATLKSEHAESYFSCFISYSHQDREFAKRLFSVLDGRNIRCWLDERQMLPGDDIYAEVDRGIRQWDKVLLCCSKHSLTSWWVDNEINSSFEKERTLMVERGGKTLVLIPLDLDGFMFSHRWKSGKKAEVESRIAAHFAGWEDDETKFIDACEKVIRALRADEHRKETPPEPKI